jgi:CRP/FNR family transcriptional regulator
VFKASADGKEKILHIFGAGEPFGEVAVFTGKPYPANAEALSKSRLLFFPKTSFVDLITRNPSLSLNMMAVLSMRLRQFAAQIEDLSLKEVPGRLAAYLLYLSDEQESNEGISLSISKGQLASLLGTIPETLSRVLAKLAVQNIIEVKGRDIILLDRKELESLAKYGRLLG